MILTMNSPLTPLLLLCFLTVAVNAGRCFDNWSRCTPQTAFATGILWKGCPDYCRQCMGRASGECKKVQNMNCSGGYQCQCSGGTVAKSNNPIVKSTCALGL